jgi:Holliday junction resolvase RusA-like endonuclease
MTAALFPSSAELVPAPAAAPVAFAVSFFVGGIARPGGSKTATVIRRKCGEIVTHNGRPLVTTREAGKHTANWRAVVAGEARRSYQGDPLTCPLQVTMQFVMPRPKGHFGTGKNRERLKVDAPVYHTSAPDCTKLVRAVEDACIGILWHDDRIIARQFAEKVFGMRPGVEINVRPLDLSESMQIGGAP